MALVPMLQGLLAGESVSTVMAGLTLAQWLNIAVAVISIEDPDVRNAVIKLSPIIAKVAIDADNLGPHMAAYAAHQQYAIAFGYEDPATPSMF